MNKIRHFGSTEYVLDPHASNLFLTPMHDIKLTLSVVPLEVCQNTLCKRCCQGSEEKGIFLKGGTRKSSMSRNQFGAKIYCEGPNYPPCCIFFWRGGGGHPSSSLSYTTVASSGYYNHCTPYNIIIMPVLKLTFEELLFEH